MHDPYKALYIHIPFCVSRCSYCDFSTQAVSFDSPALEEYAENMVLAIRRAAHEGHLAQLETVYLGGGTPSFLGTKYLSRILYALGVSMHLTDAIECSMEANPESLTDSLVKDIWALGVNRLSIGVQSFDDSVLHTLGRAHDAAAARAAVERARQRFDNVSIDLMCGIPGQTPDSFVQSLNTAVDLGVKHVSIYPLTIEDGTPFARMVDSGVLPDVDDDVQAAMMKDARDFLCSRGFSRYEVASYALYGYECKHNQAYWTGVPYKGLGPSAVTMTQNDTRRMREQDGVILDDLNARQMRAEDLMLSMRMTRGISEQTVAVSTDLLPSLPAVLDSLEAQGLISHEEGRFKPTEKGWLCGNELYGALFDLAP